MLLLHGLDIVVLDDSLEDFKFGFTEIGFLPGVLDLASQIAYVLLNTL